MPGESDMGSSSKVNLEFLHTVCDGDEDFIHSIIQTFVEDAPQILQRLVSHSEQSNWSQAGLAAHQLKPSLQFIGLNETLARVLTIERCGKEQIDLDKIPGMVELVTQEITLAVDELQRYLIQTQ